MPNAVRDSRLIVPQLPPRHVSRARLLAELDRAADVPLTLLSAGPGAGKTVLLTDWVQRGTLPDREGRVVWLSPAPADAEPRRFWRMVRGLLNRVPESAAPLVLIIDDAHVLTHPDVLAGLDSLIRGGPPGQRLVLAARSDPLLPLHRYRLAGQMYELRAADLAMTRDEIRDVLAVHGVTLAERDFDTLAERTEGWTAGVRLSAMRMEGAACPADFVSELALDPGSIGEYLVDEVLSQQPGPQRQLLIQTSFLDEVTGPLADAVTGLTGCGEMLADLARGNSFVIPLDPAGTRYRYHQLFAEILRYLLQRSLREAVRELHERAAAWFEGCGDLGNAVHWAVRSADPGRVARLLARGGLVHAFVHRLDLSDLGLRGLLPLRVPAGADPAEAAEFAIASSVIESLFADTSSTAADTLNRGPALKSDEILADPGLLLTSDLTELILGQKAFDARAVDAAAHRLLGAGDEPPVPLMPGLRAAVLLAQASSHMWHGRHEDVGSLLSRALADAARDGLPGLELEGLGLMVFVDSYWSRTIHADEAAQRAHALRKQERLTMPAILDLAAAVRSYVAGDLDGLARSLQHVLLPDVVGSDPGVAAALILGQTSVLLAGGQMNEARLVLHDLGRIPPVLAVQRDIMLAELDTSLGRPRAALRLLQGYLGGEFAIRTAVPRARAHLALGHLGQARECVRSILAEPSPQAGRFVLVDALICEARIAQLSDDPGRALETLIRALEIARDEIILPFMRAQDTFADLLSRHPAVAARWPAPRPGEPAVRPMPARPRDLADPLTQRELTVLRLLATSMTTTEIADELSVSVNTVKTHLAAIYRKLPASGRRDAVLHARELELI